MGTRDPKNCLDSEPTYVRVEAVLSFSKRAPRCAAGNCFFERSDNVIAHRTRCLRARISPKKLMPHLEYVVFSDRRYTTENSTLSFFLFLSFFGSTNRTCSLRKQKSAPEGVPKRIAGMFSPSFLWRKHFFGSSHRSSVIKVSLVGDDSVSDGEGWLVQTPACGVEAPWY